ncbi:MAG: MBL fold metallo-hydrolase [Candidatus Lokiarchaeota archaeon]|nr:MBL fold metallo-hydrolase [Candidatus Lokiarchaeota archaeon]
MKIRILLDNENLKDFERSWAFSCLIEKDNKMFLFDTGDGNKTLNNLRLFDLGPKDIDYIILSHPHFDHTGGLHFFLEANKDIKICIPFFFPHSFFNELNYSNVIEIFEFQEIEKRVYVDIAGLNYMEQFLMIETKKGILIITGCAHPGLIPIIEKCKANFENIYGIIGGFHGFRDLDYLNSLSLIIPCHCTTYKDQILTKYPQKAKKCASGCIFEF